MKNRRRLANYIIDPYLQLKFAAYTTLITLVSVVATMVFSSLFLHGVLENVGAGGDTDGVTATYMAQEVRTFLVWLGIILTGLVATVFAYTLLHTHRIAGAQFAIIKHVRGELMQDRFERRIHLRQDDFLHPIAQSVNELTEMLREGGEPAREARESSA